VVAERRQVASEDLMEAPGAPAPLAGQHSEAVLADWLDLGPDEIATLMASGVVGPLEASVLEAAEAVRAMDRATG
jgi:hypothetical protein